jgi:hypothetical protein
MGAARCSGNTEAVRRRQSSQPSRHPSAVSPTPGQGAASSHSTLTSASTATRATGAGAVGLISMGAGSLGMTLGRDPAQRVSPHEPPQIGETGAAEIGPHPCVGTGRLDDGYQRIGKHA